MNPLLKKLKQNSVVKEAQAVKDSAYFRETHFYDTGIPALNIMLSGRVNGGLSYGFSMIGGYKASYKSTLSLMLVRAFLNADPENVCIFYDSEYGTSRDYMASQGVDIERVLHIPIDDIETLKQDIAAQLNELEVDAKVMFFIDSLGMLASRKETDDALAQKTAVDMTKAKELGSFVRILTPKLNKKRLICVAINHVYKEMSLYGGDINSGGEKLQYAANSIIHISKAQVKEGTDLAGFKFTLKADKSRYIKEKSKMPLIVTFEGGISKYSGIFDLALELGWITSPSKGWYSLVNKQTGEVEEQKFRRSDVENNAEFMEKLFANGMSEEISERFLLAGKEKTIVQLSDEYDNNASKEDIAADYEESDDDED